ncbi:hypothetical protein AB0J55_16190 [Amycolatopsis sp. NPDC049688]|uniref:hypothetical protein n=1 Tax=Amycolatopsis sp. NPDC049688 TaxID=3154733 RepID=UPI00343B83D6
MSTEAIVTRIAEMSTGSLWALVALFAVIFSGAFLLVRQFLKNRQPGDRVRVKAPFFEIEAGPPPVAEAQLQEQRNDDDGTTPKPKGTSPPVARSPRRTGGAEQR